jgi:hypothetical protein
MSWTKRQFVEAAFEEIGLAANTFDLTPGQIESAANLLDVMVSAWNAGGIRISYPVPSDPKNNDLDADKCAPDSANAAIIKNLAVQLAPRYGKTVSPDTKMAAKIALDALRTQMVKIPTMHLGNCIPLGSGNKGRTFIDDVSESIETGNDGILDELE